MTRPLADCAPIAMGVVAGLLIAAGVGLPVGWPEVCASLLLAGAIDLAARRSVR